jgi:hypothetical protein
MISFILAQVTKLKTSLRLLFLLLGMLTSWAKSPIFFLVIEFTWKSLPDGNLCVSLTQHSLIDTLLDNMGISIDNVSSYSSPYCSGFPIDSVPFVEMSSSERDAPRLKYQSLVGSLNWLAHNYSP